MELLFEALGWLFQFLLELLLNMVMQALSLLLGHALKEPLRRSGPLHPALALLGYAIYGGLVGGASLWLYPAHFAHALWLRALSLLLAPLISGLFCAAVGWWRQRHGQATIRLETFLYGFTFALVFALVRAVWAQ